MPFVLKAMLLGLVLLCAAAVLFLSRPAPLPPPASQQAVVIRNIDKEQIAAVTLRPSNDSPYTLMQKDGQFSLIDDAKTPVNQILADEIFSALSSMSAIAIVKEQVEDSELSDFGVTASSVRMGVQTLDGQTNGYAVGSFLPGEVLSWFLYDERSRTVFMTEVNYQDLCNVTRKELHPVPGINFTPDLVTGIDISGPQPFGLAQKDGLWYLTAPFAYPADAEKVRDLTRKVGRMRLAVYEGEADQLDLADFGLDAPRMDIRIHFAPSVISRLDENKAVLSQTDVPAHDERFLIGNGISAVGFYCLYNGAVYKAADASMGFWLRIKDEDYTLKNPINFQPAILKELVIERGDTVLRYTVSLFEQVLPNNQIATSDDGSIQYDMYVTLNGAEINAQSFVRQYLELTGLRVSSPIEGFSAEGKTPFLTLRILHEHGERAVRFYDADALYAAASVDGTVRYLVEKQLLNSLSLLSLR